MKIVIRKEELKETMEAIIGVIKKEFPDTASNIICSILKVEINDS